MVAISLFGGDGSGQGECVLLQHTIEIETPTAGMASYTSSVNPHGGLTATAIVRADVASPPAEDSKSFTDRLLQALATMAVRSKRRQADLSAALARANLDTDPHGVTEALRARQVYWAEREHDGEALHFRQYLEQHPGEQVVLVDDILRTGKNLDELKRLLEEKGTELGLKIHAQHEDIFKFMHRI